MKHPLKTKKIVKICILFFIFIIFLLYLNSFFAPLIEKQNPFYTSEEHIENLGIEIIKLSTEEEQKLCSIIERTIMAGFKYYDTGDEKEFEKVEDLFLTVEYERIKKSIKNARKDRKMLEEYCKIPVEISEVKFSRARRYKDLENKIGMITLLPLAVPNFVGSGCAGDPLYIFVFKKMDNEWKIEKMETTRIGWPPAEITEGYVIYELLHMKQHGIEIAELSTEEEQKLHSIIRNAYEEKLPSKVEHLEIWFDSPRKYKELDERIGIISFLAYIYPPPDNHELYRKFKWSTKHIIFILKKENDNWEIEKIGDEWNNIHEKEEDLIQEIKEGL